MKRAGLGRGNAATLEAQSLGRREASEANERAKITAASAWVAGGNEEWELESVGMVLFRSS